MTKRELEARVKELEARVAEQSAVIARLMAPQVPTYVPMPYPAPAPIQVPFAPYVQPCARGRLTVCFCPACQALQPSTITYYGGVAPLTVDGGVAPLTFDHLPRASGNLTTTIVQQGTAWDTAGCAAAPLGLGAIIVGGAPGQQTVGPLASCVSSVH